MSTGKGIAIAGVWIGAAIMETTHLGVEHPFWILFAAFITSAAIAES